jgi:medium-chain acyl-[acyl-carrier-protein] hydrolase
MASSELSAYLVRYQARPQARVRLLCFAHAGGNASTFAAWYRVLPPHIEVLGVQLPGREKRRSEAPIVDMALLQAQLADALVGQHDRPVALLGYSLGALIAFEYARTLRRMCVKAPVHLVVGAAPAPHNRPNAAISHLREAEFLTEVLRRYGGIPKVILDDPDLLNYFLPALRADVRLMESYRYEDEAPLSCPIFAVGGTDDPGVSAKQLREWGAQTEAQFTWRLFQGSHFFIEAHRDAFLQAVAATLTFDGRNGVRAAKVER